MKLRRSYALRSSTRKKGETGDDENSSCTVEEEVKSSEKSKDTIHEKSNTSKAEKEQTSFDFPGDKIQLFNDIEPESENEVLGEEEDHEEENDEEGSEEEDPELTIGAPQDSHYKKASTENLQIFDLPSLTRKIFRDMPFKLTMTDLPGQKKKKQKKAKSQESIHNADLIPVSTEEPSSNLGLPDTLSSELNPDIVMKDLYLSVDEKFTNPVEIIDKGNRTHEQLMKKSVLGPNLEKLETAPLVFKSRTELKKLRRKQREESAGPSWYNLPKTELTDSVKRDLQMIKMRNVIDPHKHYKKDGSKELPKYFQIGTVVEGSAEFYSSRLSKKERKQTIVDQLLSDAAFRRRNKRKYLELQKRRQSGGKLHFRKMKNKRKPGSLRT